MIPKLTDFTSEELKWMIYQAKVKVTDAQDIIHYLSEDYKGVIGRYATESMRPAAQRDIEIGSQWLTKLTEAMQIVKDRETTNQN